MVDRSDTLATLSDVETWELTPALWTEVDQILDRMAAAVAAADSAALGLETIRLELYSHLRANDADNGKEPRTPPSRVTRDRTVRLIRSITPPTGSDDRRPQR